MLKNAENVNSKIRTTVNKQINFQSLLKDSQGNIRSNPTDAVGQALSAGKDQFEQLSNLIKVIPKEGEVVSTTIYTFTDPATEITTKFFNKKDADNFLKRNW